MMNVIYGLVIALGLSLGGNVWLFHEERSAETAATQAKDEMVNAQNAAQACSMSVTKLETDAKAAADVHKAEIDAAKAAGVEQGKKGQGLLQKQRSTPGDECKSTSDLLTDWNKSRGLK